MTASTPTDGDSFAPMQAVISSRRMQSTVRGVFARVVEIP
jgi:hypothetical protein